MFPLPETTLRIADVAEHWSRELPGAPPSSELLNRLLSSFWTGHLSATLPGKSADESRQKLLHIIRGAGPLPGVRVASSPADFPPFMIDEPDGGVTVDLGKRIVLPAGDAGIDEVTALAAFGVLAGTVLADYGDTVAPILLALCVERNELARYCQKHGYEPPKFWFEGSARLSSAAAEGRCHRWLKGIVQQASAPRPKADIRVEALSKFPGLSRRGFDRVWEGTVPQDWRKAGRRTSAR